MVSRTTQREDFCGWQNCEFWANNIPAAEGQCLLVCNTETGAPFVLCVESEKNQVTRWQHC
ncbi:mCG148204 [Mus musculus]|nr:mCG148204 [Mus musculus]